MRVAGSWMVGFGHASFASLREAFTRKGPFRAPTLLLLLTSRSATSSRVAKK